MIPAKQAKIRRRGAGWAATRLSAAAVAIALGACGQSPHMVWSKDGADLDQTRADQRACLREADNFNFLTQSPANQSGVGANASRSQQADVYRVCMEQRGYSQGPAPVKPTADPD